MQPPLSRNAIRILQRRLFAQFRHLIYNPVNQLQQADIRSFGHRIYVRHISYRACYIGGRHLGSRAGWTEECRRNSDDIYHPDDAI